LIISDEPEKSGLLSCMSSTCSSTLLDLRIICALLRPRYGMVFAGGRPNVS
jgi:hypothetical protein